MIRRPPRSTLFPYPTLSRPPPARGGRAPKIKYVTQADIRPPRFVVFSTGFLEAGYRRFLERKLRERFGFAGTPIEVSVKDRKSTRLNSSHANISYAVFCLKK